jgi:hypothetical protein
MIRAVVRTSAHPARHSACKSRPPPARVRTSLQNAEPPADSRSGSNNRSASHASRAAAICTGPASPDPGDLVARSRRLRDVRREQGVVSSVDLHDRDSRAAQPVPDGENAGAGNATRHLAPEPSDPATGIGRRVGADRLLARSGIEALATASSSTARDRAGWGRACRQVMRGLDSSSRGGVRSRPSTDRWRES